MPAMTIREWLIREHGEEIAKAAVVVKLAAMAAQTAADKIYRKVQP